MTTIAYWRLVTTEQNPTIEQRAMLDFATQCGLAPVTALLHFFQILGGLGSEVESGGIRGLS